ncbi:hypothetical protein [Polaribacter sp. R77954]|uniref:hypothetical protein n=1 Tax=Polaribacter sp. R77954 TaxID=3093870 RepID=UPI0037CC233D
MNLFFYKNRKVILAVAILLLIIGIIMAYFYWGVEPQETISGAFCGIGLSIAIFSLSLKKG